MKVAVLVSFYLLAAIAEGQTLTVTNVVNWGLLDTHLAPSTSVLIYGSFPNGAGRSFSITVGGATGGINVAFTQYFLLAEIPTNAALGKQTLTVNYLGTSSNAFPVTLAAYAPEFLGNSVESAGPSSAPSPPTFGPYYPFQHATTGMSVTPASPAAPGEVVVASTSGLGQTTTPLAMTPTITVSGENATLATVPAGSPGSKVYFAVPADAPSGMDPVTLTIGGVSSNTAGLAVGKPFAAPPTPTAASVGPVNGASFASGGIVPGEIASIFGTNLTSSEGINLTPSLPLATDFLNASVLVNGIPAPLFAVDDVNGQEQINFEVPWEAANLPTATLQIVNWNGAISSAISVPVLATQPGIISYDSGGTSFGVVLHTNYQLADTAHPVAAGETILIYCTGLGAVNQQPADGAASNGQTTTMTPVVMIGGSPAAVSFSGLAPDFVGLYQINAVVPSGVAAGNQTLTIAVNGAESNVVSLPIG